MKKLTIQFDQPQIEINGIVFDLQRSDGDILEDALSIQKKYVDLDVNNTEAVLASIKEITSYIDSLLGDGATAKICSNRPVGWLKSIEVLVAIAKAAFESYHEKISEDYE